MSTRRLAERAHRAAVFVVSSRHDSKLVRGLNHAAQTCADVSNNRSYDPARNGELRVLRVLGDGDVRCVFDVGANVGNWVTDAAEILPHATFHCFEIVPETAEELSRHTTLLGTRVHVNAVGLGEAPGTVPVSINPRFSEGATVTGLEHPGLPLEVQPGELITGETYCSEHDIGRIDLLKIDTEGLDFQVLRGFDAMLTRGAVDVVQFEYGLANIPVRTLLADFYDFLGERGFVIGKIWPHDVAFRDYDPRTDEDFRGPNYLAVRRDKTELIARLHR